MLGRTKKILGGTKQILGAPKLKLSRTKLKLGGTKQKLDGQKQILGGTKLVFYAEKWGCDRFLNVKWGGESDEGWVLGVGGVFAKYIYLINIIFLKKGFVKFKIIYICEE